MSNDLSQVRHVTNHIQPMKQWCQNTVKQCSHPEKARNKKTHIWSKLECLWENQANKDDNSD